MTLADPKTQPVEVLDDTKYSKGTGIFAIYEGVHLPEDPTKRTMALLNLGTETILEDEFCILDFLPTPGLGPVDPKETLKFSWLLSESHRLLIFDPASKRLIDELYTCSPEKDGSKMHAAMNKRLGKPSSCVRLNEIVNKDMALAEEPESLFHSVADAAGELHLVEDRQYCVSTVFFDIPDRKLDEDSLETMLTKALNKDDQKPVLESACRYNPQGYTYIHQSDKHFAGLHSYPGILKSAHLSLIGQRDAILSVLGDVEEVVYKRKKAQPTISLKVVAEGF